MVRLKIRFFKRKTQDKDFYNYYIELYKSYSAKSEFSVPFKSYNHSEIACSVKAIAFYLPQFHPIPENNQWWGRGFTEWSNVTKAIPLFNEHYQPHLPGELGFYDLRISDIQERQTELAKNYGIYGFCFYYYWFKGKRILEKPLENFISNMNINFPFCLCWANENWTRRWDGKDEEVLLHQKHDFTDDLNFIKSIEYMMKHESYIRIKDKPLLIIYKPSLFPDIKKTADIWRKYCKENGVGEIFLSFIYSFNNVTPESIGFDAAIEFPPNNYSCKEITDKFKFPAKNFSGKIYDYKDLMNASDKNYIDNNLVFRGITPSWDNSPRKIKDCRIFHSSTPDFYKNWLANLTEHTVKKYEQDMRYIFINAWNEWAEGAHLEPDRKFGYAYLDATADVLKRFSGK
jgi:lipopolysaccharide biosynthesis protein